MSGSATGRGSCSPTCSASVRGASPRSPSSARRCSAPWGLGALYLSRAEQEVLYTGLERGDVARIGAALNEAGITFDVNPKGDTVLVKTAMPAGRACCWPEKGLPNSASAGYELFDDLGSLGLTSFMQEVTRVRALEGELARTIQLMRGVKAARVHLVLPDDGSFRARPPAAFGLGRAAHANRRTRWDRRGRSSISSRPPFPA